MKMSRVIFALVCLGGLSQLVWSQDDAIGARGIPGYLNPKTGIFTTRAHSESADVAPTTTPQYYYGTISLEVLVYVVTTFPTGTVFGCDATAGTDDLGGGSFSESVTVTAAPSGGILTCNLNMPYLWQVSNPTTDVITFSFSAAALNPNTVAGKQEAYRSASRNAANYLTGIPTKNGTTTNVYCGAGQICQMRL